MTWDEGRPQALTSALPAQPRRKSPPSSVSSVAGDSEGDVAFSFSVAGPHRRLLALSLQAHLDARPEAVFARDITGNHPLHSAVAAKAADCVAVLVDRHAALDRHFDPAALVNAAGQSPLDLAAGHEGCRAALALWRPPPAPLAVVRPQRAKAGALLFDLTASPLVDDQPFVRSGGTLSKLIAGLLQADAAFLVQNRPYADWLWKRNSLAEGVSWRCHAPATEMAQRLTTMWKADDEALFAEALAVYAPDSFLHQAVHTAQPGQEIGKHVAPFLKLLHCALQSAPTEQRYHGSCYAAVSLATAEQVCHRNKSADKLLDCFRFDGIVTATTSPQSAAHQLLHGARKALVVVTPADSEDPNCCPVRLPGNGAEVAFAATQLYKVTAAGYLPGREVAARLGVGEPLGENFLIIELEAVDAFWDLVPDMVKSERQADGLGPLMAARLRADIDVYGRHTPRVATGLFCVAADLQRRGQLLDAARIYQQAMEAQVAVLGARHSSVAVTYAHLATVYEGLGQWDKALEAYRRALQLHAAAGGAALEGREGALYHRMASLFQKQGHRRRALELYGRSRTLKETAVGPNAPVVGAIAYSMGQLYHAERQFPEALAAFHQVLTVKDIPPGPVYMRMAAVYSALGDHADAIEMYRKVLAMQVEEWGPDALVVGETYAKLAQAYYLKGDTASALAVCQKALDIRLAALGEYHEDVALTYEQMGTLLQSQGESQKAIKVFQKAIHIMTRDGERPEVARLHQHMAVVYSGLGEYRLMVDMYETAVEMLTKQLGACHPEVRRVQEELYKAQHEVMAAIHLDGQQWCSIQ
eukprot:EG_transcript_3304